MAVATLIVGMAGGGTGSRPSAIGVPPRASASLTTSASNQVFSARLGAGEAGVVTVVGGAVKLAFAKGSDPNATSVRHAEIGDGGSFAFFAFEDDTRVAVVDA